MSGKADKRTVKDNGREDPGVRQTDGPAYVRSPCSAVRIHGPQSIDGFGGLRTEAIDVRQSSFQSNCRPKTIPTFDMLSASTSYMNPPISEFMPAMRGCCSGNRNGDKGDLEQNGQRENPHRAGWAAPAICKGDVMFGR